MIGLGVGVIGAAVIAFTTNPSFLTRLCQLNPTICNPPPPPPAGPVFPEFDAAFISQIRTGTPFIVQQVDFSDPNIVPRVQPMAGSTFGPQTDCVDPQDPSKFGHSGAHVHFLRKTNLPPGAAVDLINASGTAQRRGYLVKIFSPVDGQVSLKPCTNPQVTGGSPGQIPNINLTQYGMNIQFAKITQPGGGQGKVDFTMVFEPFDDCMTTCDVNLHGDENNCSSTGDKSPYCQFYKVHHGDWVTKGQHIADMWVPEPSDSGICQPPAGVTPVSAIDTSSTHIHFNVEKIDQTGQTFMCPDIFDPAQNVSSLYSGPRCSAPSECRSTTPGQSVTCPANQATSMCVDLLPSQFIQ